MLANLIIGLFIVCTLILELDAIRLPFASSRWLASPLSLKGGARPNKKSSSKGKKPKKVVDDDDQDEDEDDKYEEDRISFTGKSKSRKGKGGKQTSKHSKYNNKSKMMQLIPWGSINRGQSDKKKKGSFFREAIDRLTKTGQSLTKEGLRRAKVMKSSAFEGILLKATWPGNDPVPPELLTEIVKYSIPAFKYSRSDGDDDPYYLTMHKLWTKMYEKDWRTVTKSLYILHCISRDSSAEACKHFASAITDMSKTKNPKKPDHKYFDLKQISELEEASKPYASLVKSYASYVLYRAKTFSNRFEELKSINEKTKEEKAVAVMMKAKQLITMGMKVVVKDKKQRNIITGQAVKLVVNDLREVWKILGEKLSLLVQGGYAESAAEKKTVLELLQFYKDTADVLQKFLSVSAKTFNALKLKISSDLEREGVSSQFLAEKIEQLTSLSGGHTPKSDEDDEEEEEDDEVEEEADEEEESEESDEQDGEEEDKEEEEEEEEEEGEEATGEEKESGDDNDDEVEEEEEKTGDDVEEGGDEDEGEEEAEEEGGAEGGSEEDEEAGEGDKEEEGDGDEENGKDSENDEEDGDEVEEGDEDDE